MSGNFEIEVRGPLNEDEFQKLLEFMKKNGKFLEKEDRLSLIYFKRNEIPNDVREIEDVNIDLRLRITNKEGELVLKHGQWGGSDIRKEFTVAVENKDFEDMIQILKCLDWHVSVALPTKTHLFQYKDIEFSIVNIINFGYQYEAEILANQNPEEKKKKILSVLDDLDLSTFTKEEFRKQCNSINNTSELQFDFAKTDPKDIRVKFPSFF